MVPGSHGPKQVDPRASIALWALDDPSLLDLLPYKYPQLATQCQEPATTHPSESQAARLPILIVPVGFSPHRAQRPRTSHWPWEQEALTLPSKERMPDSPPREGKL
jgi:hypothetical protein